MRNITSLKCSSNQISDISVISNLTKLKSFSCNNNDVSDISSLSDLRCLEEVYLTGNKIIDFSPLIELPLLDIDDTYITMIGKQNIQINVKDGDVVKLPPVVKQAFELFEPAEGIDCINCKVTPDYEYCEIDPGVEGARMRISKGSMKDTIIILKPGEETESNYKLSETEKKQIKEGKENEKAIISLPKALVITLAILIIGLWVGSIVFICKKNGNKDGTSKDLKAKNSKKNDVAEKQDKKTDDKNDN
jgi:Leucine-rich repeat (LRR) protein